MCTFFYYLMSKEVFDENKLIMNLALEIIEQGKAC
jgi:hypothetical protein